MVDFPFLLYRMKMTIRMEGMRLLKYAFFILCIVWLVWNYSGLRGFIYKQLYGTPIQQPVLWDKEFIEDFNDPEAMAVMNFNGYQVRKDFKKKYAVSGLLVYHDDNTSFFKKHFWNMSGKIGEIYNQIASDDLTILWGQMASPSNRKNFKITHELNGSTYECKNANCIYDTNEMNNFHIIPASSNVAKGVSILPTKKKVPIYVEGYLVFWYGMGEYADLEMQSALSPGEISKQKAGGQQTGLCYQLYLTKLIYDGYLFE